jgi:adenine-specific DNA methylase
MSSPLDPIKKLADRVRDQTEGMGLELIGYSVVPSMGEGPDVLQAVFSLSPDAMLTQEERDAKANKTNLDAEFEALTAGLDTEIATDHESEKIEEAKEGVKDLLKDFMEE